MMEGIAFAHEEVAAICDELGTSINYRRYSKEIARKASAEWPVNRSPSVVAASAVYLVGSCRTDSPTQAEVEEAAGCSTSSIRETVPELAQHIDTRIAYYRREPWPGDETVAEVFG